MMKKILFYTNQFFGQIGGEDKAGITPRLVDEVVGTANLFKDKVENEIKQSEELESGRIASGLYIMSLFNK